MPDMTFACPSCGSELEAPDSCVGQTIECPKCSAQIELELPSGTPDQEPLPMEKIVTPPDKTMKKCPFCAEEISPDAIKCKHCGSMLTGRAQGAAAPPQIAPKVCGQAIASLVLGLLPCTCFPSLLAIIFGHIALTKINNSDGQLKGRGMAIAGLVLGYIFTVFNLIYGVICGIKAASGGAG